MVQKVMLWTLSGAKVMISDSRLDTSMEKMTPIKMMLLVDRE